MTTECTPAYAPGVDVTATAGGAITGKTFVNISGALNIVNGTPIAVTTAPAGGLTVGVASTDAPSGAKLAVIREPGAVVPVTAGGTIAVGAEVEVGTAGRAVTRDAGKVRGRAWSTGTAGTDVFIELY